jgi:hypothetical protein
MISPEPDGQVASALSARSAPALPRAVLVLLGIAVAALTGRARRHGWPSWAGSALAMLAADAIVAFLVVGVAPSVAKLAELLPKYAPSAGQLRPHSGLEPA